MRRSTVLWVQVRLWVGRLPLNLKLEYVGFKVFNPDDKVALTVFSRFTDVEERLQPALVQVLDGQRGHSDRHS